VHSHAERCSVGRWPSASPGTRCTSPGLATGGHLGRGLCHRRLQQLTRTSLDTDEGAQAPEADGPATMAKQQAIGEGTQRLSAQVRGVLLVVPPSHCKPLPIRAIRVRTPGDLVVWRPGQGPLARPADQGDAGSCPRAGPVRRCRVQSSSHSVDTNHDRSAGKIRLGKAPFQNDQSPYRRQVAACSGPASTST